MTLNQQSSQHRKRQKNQSVNRIAVNRVRTHVVTAMSVVIRVVNALKTVIIAKRIAVTAARHKVPNRVIIVSKLMILKKLWG